MIKLDLQKTIRTTQGNELLDVQLDIWENELITLFGKSGAGKTTLLRMIAGLAAPEKGFLQVGDEIWFDSTKKISLKTQKRNIGFVFQDYALFPNMTVEGHLLFAQGEKDTESAHTLLDIFHLTGLNDRKPAMLSGGQKQRLAVARALARKPAILLLDEPLSALDEETRLLLQDEIIQAHKTLGSTTILVSHDKAEVVRLSDKVYNIEFGKITASGPADDFFENNTPRGSFTAQVMETSGENIVVMINGEKVTIKNSNNNHAVKIGDNLLLRFTDRGLSIE
jgi:molybdate transport system ATP-binding protein